MTLSSVQGRTRTLVAGEPPLSEFYSLRRKSITDVFTFAGFLIGFFGSALIAWPNLKWGFDTGPIERGLAYSILILIVTGVVGAAVGGGLGLIVGRLWAAAHSYRREHAGSAGAVASASAATAPPRVEAPRGRAAATGAERSAPPRAHAVPIRFDTGFAADAFLGLMQRISPEPYDTARTSAALGRTVNIGAWNDGELVGAARVLTDGYLHAAVTDLVVHPDYRRQGIGRELLHRALDSSPSGAVTIAAQAGSAGFLEHLGCERAAAGFVLRRAAAAAGA